MNFYGLTLAVFCLPMNFAQSNIESLGMDCPGAKKSSIRISQIKKVQQQNLPQQKSQAAGRLNRIVLKETPL